MLHFFQAHIVFQVQSGTERAAVQGPPQPQAVQAGFQHVSGGRFVKGSQVGGGKTQRQRLARAGRQQVGFAISDQTAGFLFQLAKGQLSVQLGYGFASHFAGIGHGHFRADLAVRVSLHGFQRVSKPGIGQAVAEAVPGGHTEAVKVAVTHINALGVALVFHVAVVMGEGGGGGIIVVMEGPGVGQMAAGVDRSVQHVGNGASALHTGLGHEQQGFDVGELIHEGQIHRAARVHDDDHVFIQPADARQ